MGRDGRCVVFRSLRAKRTTPSRCSLPSVKSSAPAALVMQVNIYSQRLTHMSHTPVLTSYCTHPPLLYDDICGADSTPLALRARAMTAREAMVETLGEFDDEVAETFLMGDLESEDGAMRDGAPHVDASLVWAALRRVVIAQGTWY